jgi:hypothetical protein
VLAVNSKNLAKIYIVEIKIVSLSSAARVHGKKKGQEMGSIFVKLLKTNVEKMSVFRLSTMLMKTNELNRSFQDVDENKCSYRIGGSEFGIRGNAEPLAPSPASWHPRARGDAGYIPPVVCLNTWICSGGL